jgi:hypothetical protein
VNQVFDLASTYAQDRETVVLCWIAAFVVFIFMVWRLRAPVNARVQSMSRASRQRIGGSAVLFTIFGFVIAPTATALLKLTRADGTFNPTGPRLLVWLLLMGLLVLLGLSWIAFLIWIRPHWLIPKNWRD